MIQSKRVTRKNLRNNEFKSKLLNVARVTKVTTGGRRMSVSCLVVIGDENGIFGFGLGNAMEVRDAEAKALKSSQNNLFSIPLKKYSVSSDSSGKRRTIHHAVDGKYCSTKVSLFLAKPGTGIIAGPVIKSVCECVGITDIVAKIHGSSNPHNVLKACMDALMKLKSPNYYVVLKGLNDVENE